MKKLFILLTAVVILVGCKRDGLPTADDIAMGDALVSLTGLGGSVEGFDVQLRNISTNSLFVSPSDAQGVASFHVTPGLYEASVSCTRSEGRLSLIFNGVSGQFTVSHGTATAVTVPMQRVTVNPLVIKELYCGGCMMDDGVFSFQYDKCVILYNNSPAALSLDNLCFGMVAPANAQANNNNYTSEGRLSYEGEGFLPLWNGIWYFPQTLTIDPYRQVVVNIHGAINNTLTVSQSVNYAHEDYYCMYDPESGYSNVRYCPTPADVIPAEHYLKAATYALGNAWPFSNSSPALVLFQTQGVTPADFAADVTNYWYDGGGSQIAKRCIKVPDEWIVDAVEVFSNDYATQCVKRLTADVDAGFVGMTNKKGHTLYRNVNREAVEALPENEGKLVYGYALGTDGSTDPSGIDAEASLANGAHIVYQDTNNSTNDFHERQLCSLRK